VSDRTTQDIVLWGSTQVGKTTALASYLAIPPSWIADDDASRTELWAVRSDWNLLKQNHLVAGTSKAMWRPFQHRDGAMIRFRDIRGGHSLDSADEAAVLRKTSAALLFVEWPAQRALIDELAIENALAQIPAATPRALVITKCESQLTSAEFAMCVASPRKFAEERPPGVALRRLLSKFQGDAVFPITVYGWKDGLPAQYYNEFGHFVPWAIEPAMVERPFDYIVAQVAGELRA
jgi:hypothetical protein